MQGMGFSQDTEIDRAEQSRRNFSSSIAHLSQQLVHARREKMLQNGSWSK